MVFKTWQIYAFLVKNVEYCAIFLASGTCTNGNIKVLFCIIKGCPEQNVIFLSYRDWEKIQTDLNSQLQMLLKNGRSLRFWIILLNLTRPHKEVYLFEKGKIS
jgi:hypothetical protein